VLTTYGELREEGWSPDTPCGIHAKPVRTKLDESMWIPETPFWKAPVHSFNAEWRVYILRGKILGMGRYDDGEEEDEDAMPDMSVVDNMVGRYTENGAPAGYGLDVGISDEDGMTKLVEVNDGWALGLYKGNCSPSDYLDLLEARWEEIIDSYWHPLEELKCN
jgi:hypothetical protein